MSQKDAKTSYKEIVLKQLRQPLKLRVLLVPGRIAGWYLAILQPLEPTRRPPPPPASAANARGLPPLARSTSSRNPSSPTKGRVLVGADINELMRYVITQMRTSPLKLLDLKPEKPKDLGPFEALGLKLTLEGRYTEIDEFLKWVETDERLLRIDAIRLDPLAKDPSRLTAQVLLLDSGRETGADQRKPSRNRTRNHEYDEAVQAVAHAAHGRVSRLRGLLDSFERQRSRRWSVRPGQGSRQHRARTARGG